MTNKKINYLYITFTGLADPLGRSQVLPYIDGLCKRGVTIFLISLEKEKTSKKNSDLKKELKERGIIWYELKYFKLGFLGMIINILQSFLVSFIVIIFKNIKIIHTRAYPPTFSILLLKNIFGLKLIFDMRGFWPEELVDVGRIKNNAFIFNCLKFFEKISILSSDKIITLTPESREVIKTKYKTDCVDWMPTCVDIDKFSTSERISFNNKFVLVYSGSLWSYYNMPAMVDFFIALKNKINNAHFLILGNNEPDGLNALFLEKGLVKDDYTILTLSSQDVPKYLNSCNLAISFIYDRYSKKASFPTKIAEYLASGLPVVINTQSRAISDLIISNKLGIVIKDLGVGVLEKAAEKIGAFVADSSIKKRCRQVAQKHLASSVCVDKYYKIYQELKIK